MLWHSSGTVVPVEERTSDVNFNMGVASRGRTMLRWQPFLHFQLVSTINHVPGFTKGITGSNPLSLVSFALYANSFFVDSIVNNTALCYVPSSLQCSSVWQRDS